MATFLLLEAISQRQGARGRSEGSQRLAIATMISLGIGLHLAALVAGVVATLSGLDWLVRAAGILVAATGICLAHTLRETGLRRSRYDAK